jgi:succinyl-diaminopimelate desuccinylase
VDHLRRYLDDVVDEGAGDVVELVDHADGAPPGLGHPLLAGLARRVGEPPRAKLGWTDVSLFSARGIPATNFGPGDPAVAHSADERVERAEMDATFEALRSLLEEGAGA